MSRRRDVFVFSRGGRTVYPWHEWLDGSIWECKRGIDFSSTPKSFRSVVYAAAARRGLRVRASLLDDTTIVFQAVTPDDNGQVA